MFFQPAGELTFGKFSGSKIHHRGICLLFAGNDFPSVLLEKYVHEHEGNPFVAVDEWMIFAHMVSVRRCFIEDGFVNVLALERRSRLSERRFKKVAVSQTREATITVQEVGMNDNDEFVRNEPDGHYLARAFSVSRNFRFVRSYAFAHSANFGLKGVRMIPSPVSTRWSSSPSLR